MAGAVTVIRTIVLTSGMFALVGVAVRAAACCAFVAPGHRTGLAGGLPGRRGRAASVCLLLMRRAVASVHSQVLAARFAAGMAAAVAAAVNRTPITAFHTTGCRKSANRKQNRHHYCNQCYFR